MGIYGTIEISKFKLERNIAMNLIDAMIKADFLSDRATDLSNKNHIVVGKVY